MLTLRLGKGQAAALMEFPPVGQLRQAILAGQPGFTQQGKAYPAHQPGTTEKDRQPHCGVEYQGQEGRRSSCQDVVGQ